MQGSFFVRYSSGVPPLPIPNREVKPAYADGTAVTCGRVGSRLLKEPCSDAGLLFCSYSSYSSRAVRSRDRSGRFPFSVSLRRRDIIPAALGPFRVLFRNGCRSGCPEGNACNGIRPNMRESCIAIALGGMFRTFRRLSRNRNLSGSVPEGLFMGPPSFFFGGSFASERSIRVSVPGARSVGCMRRTPECPSILPVSSRSPDRTDPKTHARRKSRTKMQ